MSTLTIEAITQATEGTPESTRIFLFRTHKGGTWYEKIRGHKYWLLESEVVRELKKSLDWPQIKEEFFLEDNWGILRFLGENNGR